MYFCIDKIWYFQREGHNIRNPKRPPNRKADSTQRSLVNFPSDIGHLVACSISNDLWLTGFGMDPIQSSPTGNLLETKRPDKIMTILSFSA